MKKADIIIIACVLLAAGIAFAVGALSHKASASVVVYLGGEEYARVSVNEYQSITIDQGDGKVNVVRIDEHGVCMESSSCKNQLCVKQGIIDPENADELLLANWIVCLPNGVTVELEGAK